MKGEGAKGRAKGPHLPAPVFLGPPEGHLVQEGGGLLFLVGDQEFDFFVDSLQFEPGVFELCNMQIPPQELDIGVQDQLAYPVDSAEAQAIPEPARQFPFRVRIPPDNPCIERQAVRTGRKGQLKGDGRFNLSEGLSGFQEAARLRDIHDPVG